MDKGTFVEDSHLKGSSIPTKWRSLHIKCQEQVLVSTILVLQRDLAARVVIFCPLSVKVQSLIMVLEAYRYHSRLLQAIRSST